MATSKVLEGTEHLPPFTSVPGSEPTAYVEAIRSSGLTIYDPIMIGDPELWIPSPELELLLDSGLRGLSLAGLPLRTRSKVVKEAVCTVLGYPVPASFQKTQPRFPGQFFDTYTQKSNNLQVWNEELSPTRRYVIIRTSPNDVVTRVRVVTGDTLALLDKTGTLTQKYQARFVLGTEPAELVTAFDTVALARLVVDKVDPENMVSPVAHPKSRELLSIRTAFEKLGAIIGAGFPDAGVDQERNRGAALHTLVCAALGYAAYQDDGQFPDVRHQLIEVKLQTAPTIDLGLVRPDSAAPLDVPMIDSHQIRHCDVRYAVFYGRITAGRVEITHLILTTGEAFFSRFQQFQGKVLNAKLQIPLPGDFFD